MSLDLVKKSMKQMVEELNQQEKLTPRKVIPPRKEATLIVEVPPNVVTKTKKPKATK